MSGSSASSGASMRLVLDRARVDIASGGTLRVAATVTNDGERPVTPELQVSGIDAELVSGACVLPPVPPGASWTAELMVRLPDDAPAGTRRLAVVAHDRTGRAEPAAAHLDLATGSAAHVAVRLSPRELRGRMRARFRVHVDNLGDEPVALDLRASGDGMRVRLRPATVTLPAGASVRVRGRARASRPAVTRARRRPFLVTAQGATTPVTEAGSFEQHTVLDGVLLRAVAVLVVLGLWAGGAVAAIRHFGADTRPSSLGASATTTSTLAPPSETPGGTSAAAVNAGEQPAGGDDAARAGTGAATTVATGAQRAAAATSVAARAAVSGSVSGPPQLAGIAVTLARVSLGDLPGGGGGKLLAPAAAAPSGTVAEQRTTTDEGGRFRFSSGLELPALYRVTAIKPGYDEASVVAEITSAAPSVELAITLVAATGRLSGRVTGADGAPLGDATVTVASTTVTYGAAVTSAGDGIGTWSIDGIATPGSYVVSAVSPGHAAASTVVTLGGGETRSSVDLALQAGLGTIRGTVSSRGAGVGAVSVTAQQVGGDVERSTTTLTQAGVVGRFELPGLPLGRYTVTVSGEGWLAATSTVVVDSGEVELTIGDLRRATATIQGRVLQDALASPPCTYPSANYDPSTIRPQACGNVGVTVAGAAGTWRTTTAGGDGAFVVSGIPPGTYTVTFERFGYVTATATTTVAAGDVATVGPDGPTGVEPVVLRLVSAGGQGLAVVQGVLRDDSAPTVDLRVECLLTRVTVTDGTGSLASTVLDAVAMPDQCPSAGLTAPSPPPSAYVLPCAPVQNATGPRACWLTGGGIRILGVRAGAVQLRVGALGFDDATQVVQVPSGGTVELGVVLLRPLATLAGIVLGPNDTPLDAARVMVVPATANVGLPAVPPAPDGGWALCDYAVDGTTVERGVCVETDAGGGYRFGRALGTGRYRVIAPVGALAGWPAPAAVPLDHEQRERVVDVQAGAITNLDLSLRRYGAIYGVLQTPNASGGFDFLDGVAITVTSRGDGLVACQDPVAGPIAGACRISRSAAGHYRVDRLRERPGDGYDVTYTKTDGAGVVYGTAPEPLDGGVPFNTELLRNQILTVPNWQVAGTVSWLATPGERRVVPGATVVVTGVSSYEVLALPPYREATVSSYTSTSAANGAFATNAPSPPFVSPQITVTVSAPGFQTRTITVTNAGGTTTTADIELEPLPQALNGTIALSPALVTSGSPLDIATAAETYARLTVTAIAAGTGQQTVTSVTSSGTFAMPGLRPGRYDVSVAGVGVDAASSANVLLPPDSTTVEVSNLAVTRHGRIRVVVREAGGAPAKGATVTLRRSTGAIVQTATTCVDPTEVGGIAGCAAGTVTFDDLLANGDGTWTFTISVRKLGWRAPVDATVDLATVRSQEVVRPGLTQFGWIVGRLMGKTDAADPNPQPLAGATVTTAGITAVAGADGRFTIVGDLNAASYDLTVTASGYNDGTVTGVTVTDATATDVGDVALIARVATLTGRVTDAGSGSNLGGVTVSVPALSLSTTTAADGTYTLTVPPGVRTVDYTATDGRPVVTRVVTLVPGGTLTMNVAMTGPTGTVFGVVEGADAAGALSPLGGATVTLTRQSDGSVLGSLTTGTSGSYSFSNAPANVALVVTATKTGYATATATGVTVAPNASVYQPLVLYADPRTVTVTVQSQSGAAPLAGVTVVATSGTTVVQGTTAGLGTVALGLRPGSWTLTTTGATTAVAHYDAVSPATGSTTVSVPTPEVATLPTPTITLKPWETLQVVLQGKPNAIDPAAPTTALSGATVEATVNGSTVSLPEVSGTPGTYRVAGPFGATTYTLALAATGYDSASVPGLSTVANGVASTTQTLIGTTRTVTITVRSTQGGNLDGVAVDAAIAGQATYASATSSGGGTVTLSLPPSANWRLTTRDAATATIAGIGTVPHVDRSAVVLAVPLAPASAASNLDLSPVSAAITGQVTSTFSSVLMSGTTQGAAGANVTAALGTWSVSSGVLATSSYTLNVWRANGWSVTGTLTGHTAPAALTVNVGASGATADPAFERAPAALAGAVTTSGGAGVGGVAITVRRANSTTVIATISSAAGSGAYRIELLDPYEAYDVTFDGSSLAGASKRQPVTYRTNPVAAGTDITLNHTLSATAGGITVDVVGELQGQPGVAYAMPSAPGVSVANATANVADPLALTPTANGSGGWTSGVDGLPPSSTYTVTVTAPSGWGTTSGGAGPVVVSNVAVTGTATTTVTVTLSPSPRSFTITFTNGDGSAYTPPGGTTAPTLKGGGLGGAGLAGTPAGGGAFTFTPVPISEAPGALYRVTLPTFTGMVGGDTDTFAITASTPAPTITLERLVATVNAASTIDGTAAPVTDATVTVSVDGTAPTYTFIAPTGGATTYTINGVLRGRAPIVRATRTGYAQATVSADSTFSGGQSQAVSLTLSLSTVSATATVNSSAGNTVSFVNGSITATASLAGGGTANRGPFTFSGSSPRAAALTLEPGTWSLSVSANTHVTTAGSITVTSAGGSTAVTLPYLHTVTLTVSSSVGGTTLTNLAATNMGTAAGSVSGNVITYSVVSGTYSVTVSADNHASQSPSVVVTVSGTATQNTNVTLNKWETVVVNLSTSGTGAPVSGATGTATVAGVVYTLSPTGTAGQYSASGPFVASGSQSVVIAMNAGGTPVGTTDTVNFTDGQTVTYSLTV